jgi:NitT/TauT family transport system substrate-binding protein
MTRRLCGAGALWALCAALALGAGAGDKRSAVVRVAALNGPSAIPLAYLFENPPDLGGAGSSFEVAASPDVLLPRLLKGEVDAGILPVNIAAKVYTAANGAVVLAAVTGEGMVSLVTNDPAVNSLAHLAGKRVYVAGQGATPDYLFRYLLAANGVETGEGLDRVTLDFSVPAPELAAALATGRIGYAVMPEPFATVITGQDPSFRRAIDFQKEFAAAQGDPDAAYPVTALVARSEFAARRPDTLRLLLKSVKEAVAWTNSHPDEAGALTQKHTLGLQAALAARAIPFSALVFKTAREARPGVERLLGVFLRIDPSSVGGALPGSGFYFE